MAILTVSSPPPAGLAEALAAAGFRFWWEAGTGRCPDAAAVATQAFITAYAGSAAELTWTKAQKQTALDLLLDNNFDLKAFIRAGTSTTITGTNVGAFLATITDNYRTLRASIAAGATVAAVNAININAGWPANP